MAKRGERSLGDRLADGIAAGVVVAIVGAVASIWLLQYGLMWPMVAIGGGFIVGFVAGWLVGRHALDGLNFVDPWPW